MPPIASSTVRSGDVESSFINRRDYRSAVEPRTGNRDQFCFEIDYNRRDARESRNFFLDRCFTVTTGHLWDGQFDLVGIHISYVMPSPADAPPGHLLIGSVHHSDAAAEGGESADGEFLDSISEAIEDLWVNIITHCAMEISGIHTL